MLAAAKEGNYETLKILLHGSRITPFVLNIRSESNKDYAALDYGLQRRHRGIVQTLVEAGAPITNQSFTRACETGDLGLVKLLLDSKNLQETLNFNHALHKVCRRGFVEVANYLLSLGADVNCYYQSQALITTPLSEALLSGHVKLAHQLIKLGADIDFAQKILGWSDIMLAIVLQDSYGLLKAYDRGESIDLNAKDWSLIPKALQQTCRGEACDITYLLRIMPKNQLPEPCPAWRKHWSAVSAQIPEAKKAYAIIRLKEVLINYNQQRSTDIRETHYGMLSILFGGFSKQEKLSTVEKLLNHFTGKCMEPLTPREVRILSQGKLGENLRAWEKENHTNLQDTALWFAVNILKSHWPARLPVPFPA